MMTAIAAPLKRKQPALAQACVLCRIAHTACTGTKPCRRCVTEGTPDKCQFTEPKKRGRPPRLDKKPKTEDDGQTGTTTATATGSGPSLQPQPVAAGSGHGHGPRSSPAAQVQPMTPIALSPYPVPSSFISLFVHNGSPMHTLPPPASTQHYHHHQQPTQPQSSHTQPQQNGSGLPHAALPNHAQQPQPQPSQQPQPQPQPQHQQFAATASISHSPSGSGPGSSSTSHFASFIHSASPSTTLPSPTFNVSTLSSSASPAATPASPPPPPAMDSLLSLLVQEIKDLKKTVKTVQSEMEALKKRQTDLEKTVAESLPRSQASSSLSPSSAYPPTHFNSSSSSSSSSYSASSSLYASTPGGGAIYAGGRGSSPHYLSFNAGGPAAASTSLQSPHSMIMEPSFPSYASLHDSLVVARQNILQHFPFLADYDLGSPSIPFVVDDIRKPCWAYSVRPRHLGEDMKPPTIVYANTAFCRLTGFASHELLGMSSQRITYLEDEHKKKMIHLIYQQSPVPYTEVLNLTFKCLRKDMRALRLHARYQIFYGSNAKWQWVMACVERIEHIPLTPEEEAKLNSLALTVSSNPHRAYSQGLCIHCGISTSVSLSPQGEGTSGERSSPSQPIVCASCSVARRHHSPYTMPDNNPSQPSRHDGGVQNFVSGNHYAPPAPTQHPGVHPPSSSGGGGGLGVHSPPPPQSPDYGAYWAM